jgi:hypothetical protein
MDDVWLFQLILCLCAVADVGAEKYLLSVLRPRCLVLVLVQGSQKPDAVGAAGKDAMLAGYRHIDTYGPQPDFRSGGSLDHRALAYGKEDEVGQGIKDFGVPPGRHLDHDQVA